MPHQNSCSMASSKARLSRNKASKFVRLLLSLALVSLGAWLSCNLPMANTLASTTSQTGGTRQPILSATTATSTMTNTSTPKHETVKVNFTDCGSKNIKEVRITPCPGDGSVCNINLGTNVTVEADFVAKHEASSLSEIIKGIIRGRELQFPEQRADPCKSTISPHCPIKVGKHYQYRASFEVKPHYPAIPVKVRYALANANGDIVACVQISAKIVDPSPVRSTRNKPKKKTA